VARAGSLKRPPGVTPTGPPDGLAEHGRLKIIRALPAGIGSDPTYRQTPDSMPRARATNGRR